MRTTPPAFTGSAYRTALMGQFPDTQWTLIRRSGETPSARHAAFSELARDYRPAILAFFRSRLSLADADDAAQSFLAASFEHRWWARADAEIGSFRGFLLTMLHRHLSHLRAARRPTEGMHAIDALPDPTADAERQFDARFALLLTRQSLDILRMRYRARDRAALFDQLVHLLAQPPDHGQLQHCAEALGLPANTLTVELKRLRARLQTVMREQLRQLCANESTLEVEWAALQAVLGNKHL